jgi:hypothetical protein
MSASASSSNLSEQNGEDLDSDKEEYLKSPELVNKEKHVFILSSAGKPIYSRYLNNYREARWCNRGS